MHVGRESDRAAWWDTWYPAKVNPSQKQKALDEEILEILWELSFWTVWTVQNRVMFFSFGSKRQKPLCKMVVSSRQRSWKSDINIFCQPLEWSINCRAMALLQPCLSKLLTIITSTKSFVLPFFPAFINASCETMICQHGYLYDREVSNWTNPGDPASQWTG